MLSHHSEFCGDREYIFLGEFIYPYAEKLGIEPKISLQEDFVDWKIGVYGTVFFEKHIAKSVATILTGLS